MSELPRSLQSWVLTIQTVVLTADVFQLYIICISADSKCWVLVYDAKSEHRAWPWKHASLGRKSKSSATRRRGLLRIAIFTAPHISGSGGSTFPRVWPFMHPPCNKKWNTIVRMSYLKVARLKCDDMIVSWGERCGSSTAIQQALPYAEQQRYILAVRVGTCLILPGGWHPFDASRRCTSRAEHDLWSALKVSPSCVWVNV